MCDKFELRSARVQKVPCVLQLSKRNVSTMSIAT